MRKSPKQEEVVVNNKNKSKFQGIENNVYIGDVNSNTNLMNSKIFVNFS